LHSPYVYMCTMYTFYVYQVCEVMERRWAVGLSNYLIQWKNEFWNRLFFYYRFYVLVDICKPFGSIKMGADRLYKTTGYIIYKTYIQMCTYTCINIQIFGWNFWFHHTIGHICFRFIKFLELDCVKSTMCLNITCFLCH
jgi:hypothetical protein